MNGGQSQSTDQDWVKQKGHSIKFVGKIKEEWKKELCVKVHVIILEAFRKNGSDGTKPINVKQIRKLIDNGSKSGNSGKVRYAEIDGEQPNGPIPLGVTGTHNFKTMNWCNIGNEIHVPHSYGGRDEWRGDVTPVDLGSAFTVSPVPVRRRIKCFVQSLAHAYDFVRFCADTRCERECRAYGIIGDLACPIAATLDEALELNGEAADLSIQARRDAQAGRI